MSGEFLSDQEVRRGYHSGLSGRVIPEDALLDENAYLVQEKLIRFKTFKYRPPLFNITLRSDKNAWADLEGDFDEDAGTWLFRLPAATFAEDFKMKLVLHDVGPNETDIFWMAGGDVKIDSREKYHDFNDAHVLFAYDIEFKTDLWHPDHLVTLRNNVDGWGRDLYGVFRDDTWFFRLDRATYPDSFRIKLALERSMFMEGDDLLLSPAEQRYELSDAQVTFAASPTAYRHGYDNFVSTESRDEQLTVPAIGRENESFDVIVIGSGMGGGVLADALSDRRVKVLVLEAGGLRFPVHMNELPRSEIDFVGRDQLKHFHHTGTAGGFANSGVHFNLGGRSVYWSGLIPQMQAWEFRDRWPAVVRDYLLNGDDGESGYQAAEKLMRKQKTLGPYQDDVVRLLTESLENEFIVEDLPRSLHQPDLDPDNCLRNVIERSTGGFSTADLLLDSLGFTEDVGKNYLRVNLHHLVKRIETVGGQATAVVCEDLIGNTERRYEAGFVVLACGSLESAKLALLSDLRNDNQKIGVGLTDHPAYFYKNLHVLPDTGDLAWLSDPLGHAKIMLRHRDASADHHPYNIELLINAKYWDTRHADDDLWNQRIANGKAAKVEIKFIFDSVLDEGNSITSNGEGKKPRVHFDINSSAEQYKQEIVDDRNRILEQLGVTGLKTCFDKTQWDQGTHGSVHHAGGTLRMCDHGGGVVDPDLKFEAYDNLYCCDVSVFPTIPAANPSLTLAALALRLANHLQGRVHGAS